MRILLRNSLSEEFLKMDGGWTKQQKDGRTFETSCEAVQYAAQFKDPGLEVLFAFEECQRELRIPLRRAAAG